MAAEKDQDFFYEVQEVKDTIKDMSLGNFTVGDLESLLGFQGLVDGITSVFHPSREDLQTIKERLQNPISTGVKKEQS